MTLKPEFDALWAKDPNAPVHKATELSSVHLSKLKEIADALELTGQLGLALKLEHIHQQLQNAVYFFTQADFQNSRERTAECREASARLTEMAKEVIKLGLLPKSLEKGRPLESYFESEACGYSDPPKAKDGDS
jgi:hypothetical protein